MPGQFLESSFPLPWGATRHLPAPYRWGLGMMKGSRAYAVLTLALIISMIAVVVALGGGAYASAHSTRQSQATGVRLTEHALKLINGWQSAN